MSRFLNNHVVLSKNYIQWFTTFSSSASMLKYSNKKSILYCVINYNNDQKKYLNKLNNRTYFTLMIPKDGF